MNVKQIIVLIGAGIVLALILWYDLPIQFPGVIYKVFMLSVKILVVLVVAIIAYVFAGGKKTSS